LSEGRHGEAARLYRQLSKSRPNDDSFVLALAWAYHDGGQLDEAVATFETLLERELSRSIFTGFAFDELVRIYKRQGNYENLLRICERAATAQPGDYALMGDLGDACLKAGQIDRAVAIFREMVAMEPEDAVAFANLAAALVTLGDMAGADAACTRAAAIEPDKEGLYYSRLASACQKGGHIREAEDAARKSIKADPAEPARHLALGDLLIAAGRIGEGWQAYEEACSMREAAAATYYHRLGNALLQALHPEEAVRAFGKAVARDPSNPIYRLKLAESCLASGQIDLARSLLDPFPAT